MYVQRYPSDCMMLVEMPTSLQTITPQKEPSCFIMLSLAQGEKGENQTDIQRLASLALKKYGRRNNCSELKI